MDPNLLIALSTGIPLLGLVSLIVGGAIYYSNRSTQHRAMRELPLAKIADTREGQQARFVGEIEAVPISIVAPLSRQPCAFYRVEVFVLDGDQWTKVLDDQELCACLFLHDGSGLARVALADAKVLARRDFTKTDGFLSEVPAHYSEYLRSKGVATQQKGWVWNSTKKFRYREEKLVVGEEIVVAGATFLESNDSSLVDTDYRQGRQHTLVIAGNGSQPLLISEASGAPKR